MPGTFILKPVEANLTHNTDLLGRMNPYCSVVVGNTRAKGEICKKGGKHPHWNDSITVPVANETQALVELMDKDRITHDDNIGSFTVDLKEVQSSGHLSRWYPLTYHNKNAGEILVEAFFEPEALKTSGGTSKRQLYEPEKVMTSKPGVTKKEEIVTTATTHPVMTSSGRITSKNQYSEQEKILTRPPEVTKKEEIVTTTTTTTTHPATTHIVEKEVASADLSRHSTVWTEQHQVVEPHTFIKEVEVVETRPVLKEIEVMEPVRVMKEVHYTQAVPVKKHIDIFEPQVVMKEVEVIEPRLVTKTIQVVENVPVVRQVEVIEMHNTIREVDTLEPQTFHKQVEVTEFVPVKKQVEVTQPVTLKKAVEYVEPVITTQIITKEVHEPIIINEEVTTTVGPASVKGISREYGYVEGFGEISLSEQQRLATNQRWVGYEAIFYGLTEMERFFEQQRLSRLSEEEWVIERQRLLAMSPKDRMLEQRRMLGLQQKTGGYSSYSKTTETIEKTAVSQGGVDPKLESQRKYAKPTVYHPSPNF